MSDIYNLLTSANQITINAKAKKEEGIIIPALTKENLENGHSAKKALEGAKAWFLMKDKKSIKETSIFCVGSFVVSIDAEGNPYHIDRSISDALRANAGQGSKEGLLKNNRLFLTPKDGEDGIVVLHPSQLQAIKFALDDEGELEFDLEANFNYISGKYNEDFLVKLDQTSLDKGEKGGQSEYRKMLRNLFMKGVNDELKEVVEYKDGQIIEGDYTEISTEDFHYYGKSLQDLGVDPVYFAVGYFEAFGTFLNSYKKSGQASVNPFEVSQIMTWISPCPMPPNKQNKANKTWKGYKASEGKFVNGKFVPTKAEHKAEPKKDFTKDFTKEVKALGGFKGFYVFCKAYKAYAPEKTMDFLRQVFYGWKALAKYDKESLEYSLSEFSDENLGEEGQERLAQIISSNFERVCKMTQEEFDQLTEDAEEVEQKVLGSKPEPETEEETETEEEAKVSTRNRNNKIDLDSSSYEVDEEKTTASEPDASEPDAKISTRGRGRGQKQEVSSSYEIDEEKTTASESKSDTKAKGNPFAKAKLPEKKYGPKLL